MWRVLSVEAQWGVQLHIYIWIFSSSCLDLTIRFKAWHIKELAEKPVLPLSSFSSFSVSLQSSRCGFCWIFCNKYVIKFHFIYGSFKLFWWHTVLSVDKWENQCHQRVCYQHQFMSKGKSSQKAQRKSQLICLMKMSKGSSPCFLKAATRSFTWLWRGLNLILMPPTWANKTLSLKTPWSSVFIVRNCQVVTYFRVKRLQTGCRSWTWLGGIWLANTQTHTASSSCC